MKSCLEPVVNFESNSKSVESYQSDNKQKCIDCLKPRSNENERVCKKFGCNYFYVPNY